LRCLNGAIRAYLAKTNISPSVGGTDTDALIEAEKKLGLPEPGKKFHDLTFDEFTSVLLRHPRAPRLSQSKDVSELRELLRQVRNARNKLAYFRGELTSEERRTIQFAAEWLENNLPVSLPEISQQQPGIGPARGSGTSTWKLRSARRTLGGSAGRYTPRSQMEQEHAGSASHRRQKLNSFFYA
jgi:hypothetical protein